MLECYRSLILPILLRAEGHKTDDPEAAVEVELTRREWGLLEESLGRSCIHAEERLNRMREMRTALLDAAEGECNEHI
jgi:hypothetical protein